MRLKNRPPAWDNTKSRKLDAPPSWENQTKSFALPWNNIHSAHYKIYEDNKKSGNSLTDKTESLDNNNTSINALINKQNGNGASENHDASDIPFQDIYEVFDDIDLWDPSIPKEHQHDIYIIDKHDSVENTADEESNYETNESNAGNSIEIQVVQNSKDAVNLAFLKKNQNGRTKKSKIAVALIILTAIIGIACIVVGVLFFIDMSRSDASELGSIELDSTFIESNNSEKSSFESQTATQSNTEDISDIETEGNTDTYTELDIDVEEWANAYYNYIVKYYDGYSADNTNDSFSFLYIDDDTVTELLVFHSVNLYYTELCSYNGQEVVSVSLGQKSAATEYIERGGVIKVRSSEISNGGFGWKVTETIYSILNSSIEVVGKGEFIGYNNNDKSDFTWNKESVDEPEYNKSMNSIFDSGKSVEININKSRNEIEEYLVQIGAKKVASVVDNNSTASEQVNAEKYSEISVDPYEIKVTVSELNIRSGPGTAFDVAGSITDYGVYTIVAWAEGDGSSSGWGKLKSGAGWISLDYIENYFGEDTSNVISDTSNVWCPNCGKGFFTTGVGISGFECPNCHYRFNNPPDDHSQEFFQMCGYYVEYDLLADGNRVNKEHVAGDLYLYSDGTSLLRFNGQTVYGFWEEGIIRNRYNRADSVEFDYSGEFLTIHLTGIDLILEKVY